MPPCRRPAAALPPAYQGRLPLAAARRAQAVPLGPRARVGPLRQLWAASRLRSRARRDQPRSRSLSARVAVAA
eukprot:7380734-Prymnesium_polylepis.1